MLFFMRLGEIEKEAIKSSIKKRDPDAKIYLFGSRSDPNKRGGDIDILVISQTLSNADKIPILVHIFDKIEEQKIDLIIAQDSSDPFVRLALKNGIEL